MTKLLTFERIQKLLNGKWLSKPLDLSEELQGGAFDTRSLGEADIFFAWKGESSDGHLYLNKLVGSNIKLAIVEKQVDPIDGLAILLVDQTMAALHELAKSLVSGFEGKVINITGSSGKTTSKEWLRHVINPYRELVANQGSFNNHIGCPMTILNLNTDTEILVLEMGSSGLGELESLTAIAPADIAVLLNVGHAHVGKFGGLLNTYKAKTEVFSHTRPDALKLIPAKDRYLNETYAGEDWIRFGKDSSDFSWDLSKVDPVKMSQEIKFKTPYGEKNIIVPHLGDYVGELLSAIIAVCYHLGLGWEQVESRISTLPQEKGRSSFVTGKKGELILDDTYNANPQSVINMLSTICALKAKRTVGVVGNLAELDEGMKESSGYVVENIPENLTDLFLSGETGKILFPLIHQKYPQLNCQYFDSIIDLAEYLKLLVGKDVVVGIKGSRSSHFERLVYILKGQQVKCPLDRCGKLMMCKDCDELN